MTPQQRLEALEQLEQRQLRSQRLAVRTVWGSVVLAVIVLAGLIAFGTRKVNDLNAQRQRLESDITALTEKREAAEHAAAEAEKKRLAAVWTFSNVPEAEQKVAVERQLSKRPEMAALLPRIYMQIVDPADKSRAEAVKTALWQAGFVVLGIETVPKAAKNQKGSDVRYYRKEETEQAERIAEVLKQAGEQNVRYFIPKGMENSPNVRPNHFEVWLDRGASQ
jgi:outer membrane murein-binding lipoprotein Lpp